MSTRIDSSIYPRLHEYIADQFGHVVQRLLPDLADALLAHAAGGLKPGLVSKLAETARLLREESAVRAEVALEHFVRLQPDSVGDETLIAGASARNAGRRAALHDAELLEQILARELASAVRAALNGHYSNYLRRLEKLSSQRLRDDEHPLGARALTQALMCALKPFIHTQPISLHLRPILLSRAVAPLARLIEDSDSRLIKAGILPELAHATGHFPPPAAAVAASIARPRGKGAENTATTSSQIPPDEAGSTFVRHASRQVLNDIRASAVLAENPMSASRQRYGHYRRATQLPSIDAIEQDAVAFARQFNVAPYSQEARTQFFRQVRQQLGAAGADAAVLAVLDLVNALFDYAASDRRLPEGARILLWRLQMPAITLASLDTGYLGDDSRSIRRLVEQLAAITIAYPEEIRPDRPLYQRLQTVVRAVEIVAHAFHVRSQVLSEQVRHEYRRATRGMKQLLSRLSRSRQDYAGAGRRQPNRRDYSRRPSRMRETTVSADIRRLLDYRLGDTRVPESVRVFLHDVWLRHLRTAALRDGTSSQSYQLALKVVDDLLWTLGREGARPEARHELVQSIPPMLSMLTAGIHEVGARPEAYSAFFDEIFLIHLRRLQGHGGSAVTLIAHESEAASAMSDDSHGWPTLVAPALKDAEAAHEPGDDPASPGESGITLRQQMTIPGPAHTAAQSAGRQVSKSAQGAGSTPGAGMAGQLDHCSAAAASARLQAMIAATRMDDLPARPRRIPVPSRRSTEIFQPGQWLELVGRDGRSKQAKVVWLNERRTMLLLLLRQPGRRIMTRQIASLMKRARQNRLFLLV